MHKWSSDWLFKHKWVYIQSNDVVILLNSRRWVIVPSSFQVSYAKNWFFQRKIRIHIDTYGYTISWTIDFQWILLFYLDNAFESKKLISGMILFLKVLVLGLLMLSYYDLACEYNFMSEKLSKAYSQTTLWWRDKIGEYAKCMIELRLE